ncbi:MAG: LytR/AlgR family response regulator transcription factor [Gemmatimonadales bacterium]
MTEPVRVLVVDDEPLARSGLIALLARDPEVELVGDASDGAQAIRAIRELAPDLVLLDVQMPEVDGFAVIRAVGVERMPVVVFVTAYDEYALRAFEVNAVDYLLKPFDDRRFATALERGKRAARVASADDLAKRLVGLLSSMGGTEAAALDAEPAGNWLTRLVVRKTGTRLFVPVEEIDWIEAADYCVKVHVGARTHVIRESLSHLERRLDPSAFFRAHRSAVVNLERVQEVQPTPHGDLVLLLRTGARVRLSRSRRAALEAQLGQAL